MQMCASSTSSLIQTYSNVQLQNVLKIANLVTLEQIASQSAAHPVSTASALILTSALAANVAST